MNFQEAKGEKGEREKSGAGGIGHTLAGTREPPIWMGQLVAARTAARVRTARWMGGARHVLWVLLLCHAGAWVRAKVVSGTATLNGAPPAARCRALRSSCHTVAVLGQAALAPAHHAVRRAWPRRRVH